MDTSNMSTDMLYKKAITWYNNLTWLQQKDYMQRTWSGRMSNPSILIAAEIIVVYQKFGW